MIISTLLLLVVGGCGGSDKEPAKSPVNESMPTAAQAPAPASEPPSASTASPQSATPRDATPTTTPAATPPPTKLSDAEILAVTSAANNGEIEMAKLAMTKGQNAQVKSFAALMIKDHTDAETKGKKLAKTANITPADNETSAKLNAQVQSTLADLKSQKGTAFDKAYMDSQVKAHKDVLSIVDDKLIPNAQNPDLKTLLSDVRQHVQMHLDKAQEITQKLENGKTSAQAK
jgi:putative membrane protein